MFDLPRGKITSHRLNANLESHRDGCLKQNTFEMLVKNVTECGSAQQQWITREKSTKLA